MGDHASVQRQVPRIQGRRVGVVLDIRGALGRAYQRLRGSDLTPLRLGLSVAVGLFVGCLPLYGAHFLLCAALAMPLRLNLLVAYAAAHISIPPSLPFLWFAALQIGTVLLTGEWLPLVPTDLTPARVAKLAGTLLLGSLVLGAALGVVGGTAAFLVARLVGRRAGQPSAAVWLEKAMLRTARRYARAPAAGRYYVRFKLLLDPLAEQLLAAFRLLAAGHATSGLDPAVSRIVVDVGCGRGQYSLLLHELGLSKQTHGFDHDAAKVELAIGAARAGRAVDATYQVRDVRQGPYPEGDLVLLLDVLHYLPHADQLLVLSLAAEALRPGGHVFVRETDRGSGVGARWAAWFERVARRLGINRGEQLELVTTRSLVDMLSDAGFLVLSSERGTLDNVLCVARKMGPTPPS
jgi:uncharacterized protein (DUF2062 family)/2-polyprenyl-3-methyl-5-hydroxy-6-metoxy-1,4-benzoquinol methylase